MKTGDVDSPTDAQVFLASPLWTRQLGIILQRLSGRPGRWQPPNILIKDQRSSIYKAELNLSWSN